MTLAALKMIPFFSYTQLDLIIFSEVIIFSQNTTLQQPTFNMTDRFIQICS
jgi:hypothetical protein